MTVLEEKELTDEVVMNWYKRAMRGKINIFDDKNKIIAWLARQLLQVKFYKLGRSTLQNHNRTVL